MTKITQEHLNKVLWNAADSSRTSLDAGVYKDYVLVMLFYKYLSDLSKVQQEKYKERFGTDENRIQAKMKMDRFYLPEGTYRFTAGVTIGKSNVVIRGADSDKTKLFRPYGNNKIGIGFGQIK